MLPLARLCKPGETPNCWPSHREEEDKRMKDPIFFLSILKKSIAHRHRRLGFPPPTEAEKLLNRSLAATWKAAKYKLSMTENAIKKRRRSHEITMFLTSGIEAKETTIVGYWTSNMKSEQSRKNMQEMCDKKEKSQHPVAVKSRKYRAIKKAATAFSG